MQSNVLEVEVDKHNANLAFRPLMRQVRGAFNARNINGIESGEIISRWPERVPGQRLGIDTETGTAYIADPLYADEHRQLRKRIEAKPGWQLPPEREDFPKVHIPTWLYWIKRGIESGILKIVSGSMPETINGEPINDFIIKVRPTSNETLVAAMREQTATFDRLAVAIEKLASKR